MRRTSSLVTVVLFLIAASAALAGAQTAAPGFSIEGRVLDAMQAPIAGARVSAVADGQRSGPTTGTDQRGVFTLVLPSGSYTLTVAADGFVEQSQHVNASRAAGFRGRSCSRWLAFAKPSRSARRPPDTKWKRSAARPRR